MFRKVDIGVLGIVENMAVHICSNCGHEEHVFGQGGAESPADLRLTVRVSPVDDLSIEFGGGLGLNGGYGAPGFRALVGVTAHRLPEPASFAPLVTAEEPDWTFDEPPERPRRKKRKRTREPKPEVTAEVRIEDGRIRLPPRVLFAYDSDRLLSQALPILDAVKVLMDDNPRLAHVLVEGHASVEGDIAYNWDLSNRRSAAVYRYLVEAGVHSARLSYRGMGEAIAHHDERQGAVLEADRRVELRIIREIDEWLDEDVDWSDPPPIPWRMPEAEEAELPEQDE
jgi:outer membrane protein OmpA-like peptidoglycan-associated protein